MTKCQRCDAASQLYLCNRHIDELQDMLAGLPRLAGYLDESAFGQTKLGEPARRTKSDETPMRINFRASRELGQLYATLARWVQDLCEFRRMPIPAAVTPGMRRDPAALDSHTRVVATIATMSAWLAANVTAIASSDDAGLCYREVDRHVGRIMRIVNRPNPPRFCGPCPSTVDGIACDTRLMANRTATDVLCPTCGSIHKVAELLDGLWERIEHMSFTTADVLLIFTALNEPLSPRTFRQWRYTKRVLPTGWFDGEPLYRISHVRELTERRSVGSAT